MVTFEGIKSAIEKLDANEFDRLRRWLEQHNAARFDAKLARDAQTGKLDQLAAQATAEFRKRRLTRS